MQTDKHYDVIIIGGSYSGLAAAMALGRAVRKVLVIDAGNPCNKQTPYSHNFLTNDGKTPAEIATQARQQVLQYETVSIVNDVVVSAEKRNYDFIIATNSGEKFTAVKLIFATGIRDVMPAIPGFEACWGISVLHCPYCHGYEVRNRKTGILADGDNGFELSTLIVNWSEDITLYTNGRSTMSREQTGKLQKRQIKISEKEIGKLVHDKGYIREIVFTDGSTEPVEALYARLPFEQHAKIPENIGCAFTPEGYIMVDAKQKTTVPGVFACGDNCTRMRTVANAVSMGTAAGMMANNELLEEAMNLN